MSPKRSEGWIISNVESDVYCGMLTLLAYDVSQQKYSGSCLHQLPFGSQFSGCSQAN